MCSISWQNWNEHVQTSLLIDALNVIKFLMLEWWIWFFFSHLIINFQKIKKPKKKLETNLWISEAEISKFELIKTTFSNQFKVIDFIVQLCDNDLFTSIWKITKIVADVEWKRNSHTKIEWIVARSICETYTECWQSFNLLSRRNLRLVYC